MVLCAHFGHSYGRCNGTYRTRLLFDYKPVMALLTFLGTGMNKQKHEFAIFFEGISRLIGSNSQALLVEKELAFRLLKVLRLQPGDTLVLFDEQNAYHGQVDDIKSQSVLVTACVQKKHTPLTPHITWYLPLLEREAFEESLTALAVMGVNEIYPVATQKSRRSWGNPKERERAMRIMIAAAEQSKQFLLPVIHETIALNEIPQPKHAFLFFDVQGKLAYDLIAALKKEAPASISCMVGPEGDLTDNEKSFLRQNGAVFMALTPTVLRASTAVCVSAGLIRTLL